MRVCMITGAFPPAVCGVGDYTSILAEQLSIQEDMDISIITTKGCNLNRQDFKVFDVVAQWNFRNLPCILKTIRICKPDVVHIQYPTDQYKKNVMINLLPLLLKVLGFKVVATVHEFSYFGPKYRIRNIPNLLFADRIIVADPVYIKDILGMMPFKKGKIQHIPIFSNIPQSKRNTEEKQALRNAVCKPGTLLIGFFGFVNEKKGFEHILEALDTLRSRGTDAKLLYIGEFKKSDAYHKGILERIAALGLENDLIITGYMDKMQVADYISIADCMVFPFTDGLSPRNGTFLAALAQGVNIITTKPANSDFCRYGNVHYIDGYGEIADRIYEITMENRDGDKQGSNLPYNPAQIAGTTSAVYKEILK